MSRTFIEPKQLFGKTLKESAEELSRKLWNLKRPDSIKDPRDVTKYLYGIRPHPAIEDGYVVELNSDDVIDKHIDASGDELADFAEDLDTAGKNTVRDYVDNNTSLNVGTIVDNLSTQIVSYPLWDSFDDQHLFIAGDKVSLIQQDVDDEILVFYEIIQPHNKQDDRRPDLVPALWDEITVSRGVEVWSQPIGGDGRYPYLDPNTGNPYRVTHNGRLWENNFQSGLNVWEPGVFGWTNIGPA